ncbi:hypothetical protein VNO77_27188 [Canavalia gladiata]|uniref:Uncharacterized protein n=1 Tax=Canavalia gladiata TaxID=3824 RepID=A0AAN9KTJ8_CANGL
MQVAILFYCPCTWLARAMQEVVNLQVNHHIAHSIPLNKHKGIGLRSMRMNRNNLSGLCTSEASFQLLVGSSDSFGMTKAEVDSPFALQSKKV